MFLVHNLGGQGWVELAEDLKRSLLSIALLALKEVECTLLLCRELPASFVPGHFRGALAKKLTRLQLHSSIFLLVSRCQTRHDAYKTLLLEQRGVGVLTCKLLKILQMIQVCCVGLRLRINYLRLLLNR